MSHTPTPWEASKDGCLKIVGDKFYYVPYASPWREGAWNDDPQAIANAAFIVKACNAHEDLVASLDPETLEAIADEIDCFEHSARAGSLRGIAKRQRAALIKAGAA